MIPGGLGSALMQVERLAAALTIARNIGASDVPPAPAAPVLRAPDVSAIPSDAPELFFEAPRDTGTPPSRTLAGLRPPVPAAQERAAAIERLRLAISALEDATELPGAPLRRDVARPSNAARPSDAAPSPTRTGVPAAAIPGPAGDAASAPGPAVDQPEPGLTLSTQAAPRPPVPAGPPGASTPAGSGPQGGMPPHDGLTQASLDEAASPQQASLKAALLSAGGTDGRAPARPKPATSADGSPGASAAPADESSTAAHAGFDEGAPPARFRAGQMPDIASRGAASGVDSTASAIASPSTTTGKAGAPSDPQVTEIGGPPPSPDEAVPVDLRPFVPVATATAAATTFPLQRADVVLDELAAGLGLLAGSEAAAGQAERAGVIASFILNAAMIPGWPPPRPYELPEVEALAARLTATKPQEEDVEALAYMSKMGLRADLLARVFALLEALRRRRLVLLALAMLLTNAKAVLAALKEELERLTEDGDREEAAVLARSGRHHLPLR